MIINLGLSCKNFRKKRGYRLRDVADEVGYTIRNVSSFEHNRNDNGRILLWYFLHGMTIDDLITNGGATNGNR